MKINGSSGGFDPKIFKGTSEPIKQTEKTSTAQGEKLDSYSELKKSSQRKLLHLKSTIMNLPSDKFEALNKEMEKYFEIQAELAKETADKHIEANKYFYSLDFIRNVANSYAPEDEAWAEYIEFINKAFNTPVEVEELEKLINEVKK